jgi:hypothetical protein
MKKQKKTKVRVATRPKRQAKQQEITRLGSALRYLGGLGGSAVGALVGMPGSGATVGNSLGAALSKWLGSGDYTVGTNSIVNRVQKGSDSIPAMHAQGQSIVVRHKEYLGEIRGSATFVVRSSYELNPGNSSTFPWLSGVATHFQEYKIRGLVFHYVPTSGTAVSSTDAALGSVMLQTSYRSNDSAPTSKVEMLNEYCSNEAVPSEPFAHPVECDPRENPFNVQYVRSGAVPSGDSKLLYDLGVTHVAVSGQQATDKVLGDLWITYEIELKKPILESNVTSRTDYGALEFAAGTLTASDFMNGVSTRTGQFEISGSGRTVTFPKGAVGRYMITLRFSATTNFTTFDGGGVPSFANSTLAPYVSGTGHARNVLTGTGSLGSAFITCGVLIPSPTDIATVTFPTLTFTGSTIAFTQLTVASITV